MSVFLTDKIPYVRVEHVPGAGGVGVLPIVIGDCRAVAVPTARLTGQRYLVAGHPMQITTVRVDGQDTAFVAGVMTTALGQPVTVIDFNQSVEERAEVSAFGLGLRDADGQLIEQAGDVLRWLYGLAGIEPQLQALTVPQNQVLAGVLHDPALTVQRALGWMASHVAALVCGPSVLPVQTQPSGPVTELASTELVGLSADYALQEQWDAVDVGFDGGSTGDPRQHVLASRSTSAPAESMKSLVLPWLRTPDAADTVARAWFEWLASRRVRVSFDSPVPLQAGDWVRLWHPPLAHVFADAPGGRVLAQIMTVDEVAGLNRYTAIAPLLCPDAEPLLRRLRGSSASGGGLQAALALSHGTATITIEAPDGRLLVGAKCRLDDGPIQRSDARGQVSFVARPGVHQLQVEADGYSPFIMEVTF